MSSTFLGLQIGKSGLTAAQIALNITGQNLSNADTEGYTRQIVKTSAIGPSGRDYVISQVTAASNVGQGVEVTSISQIRSNYLDQQFRDQYADFNSSEYTAQGLGYLEDLFNELDDDTSVTVSLADFFDALSDFADDPTSEAARTTVQQTALSMTENFNIIYNEMVDLYNNQNTSVKTVATEINELAKQLAELNGAIAKYELSGQTANDLRDQRNLLLDKLSGYVGINCSTGANGMVKIQIAGETLVDGKICNEISVTTATDAINGICERLAEINGEISGTGLTPALAAERDELCEAVQAISGKVLCNVNVATGITSVTMEYVDQATMTLVSENLVSGAVNTAATAGAVSEYGGAEDEFVLNLGGTYLNDENVKSGELYAHMNLRDGDSSSHSGIPYYIGRLDDLAQSIVQTVNLCMNGGYTYPDEENGYSSVTGDTVDLFKDFSNSYSLVTAGNFSVSATVLDSVWNIAASDLPIDLNAESTQSANNVIALQLADLINKNDYSSSLDGLISHLGTTTKSSLSMLDTRQSLLESTENQRESISGVSVDEEAVNLIMYQQTYNACSRVITTMDEMLDKLINSTGTVGR